MAFTLADFTPQVAEMELIHPTIGATGIFLKLVGQDSRQFRDKAKAAAKNRMTQKKDDVDLDQLEKDNADLAASCIVGWTDDEAFGGAYTPDYASKLMHDPEFSWIREQVEVFVRDRAHFFRNAAPAAKPGAKAPRKA